MTDTTTAGAAAAVTTVDTYLAMWNEPDEARRAELIASAWTEDGRYVDPVQEAEGHAALSAMVAAIHERFPGQRFRRLRGVDVHHDQVRFGWELAAPDGGVTVAGIDVGTVARDGRLLSITGFFGDRWAGRMLNQADHIATGRAVLDAVRDAGNRWVFTWATESQ